MVKVECALAGSDTVMTMIIDSGAEVNVISEADWRRLEREWNHEKAFIYDYKEGSSRKLSAYAATSALRVIGTFSAWIETTQAEKPKSFAKFHIVKNGKRSLLGRHTAVAMNLLKIGLDVNEVNLREMETLEPFPKMPDFVVDFAIDHSVAPVRKAYYHVPAAYSTAARNRIKMLLRQGIIERVIKAPKWISGMLAIPKGKLDFRLVLSMIGPNKAILRCYFHLITPEEVRVKLHGAKYFTKLDLHKTRGEESREMTTFMTDTGMYRFTRLVFGVTCAPEIFQMAIERVLEGITNVVIFIDDILIFSETEEKLESITEKVLDALADNNLTLNEKKCEYAKEKITFLGHEISEKGLNIEEGKIKAVKAFRSPKSSSELKSFLGLASYLSSYIHNFADITEPMWRIANTKPFEWNDAAEVAFQTTKARIISCTTTQGFFSLDDYTTLYTDASPASLGAVLTQINSHGEERVISFAAKSLTPTERRYPQTQREALAIVWAVEHFYYYLLGRKFTIKTDALGISYIFRRERDEAKKTIRRAEGWAMRLAPYSFDIQHIKGSYNIADPPSRLYLGEDEEFKEDPAPMEIAEIDWAEVDDILSKSEIQKATAEDEILLQLLQALDTNDWPERLNKYRAVKHELTSHNSLIMKGAAVVVPEKLIGKALRASHIGHPGCTAMKSILRARVWWIGMTADIEAHVDACLSCTLTSRANKPVPMTRTALPDVPWDMVAIDYNGPYARFGGLMIMVMVDCYSRYLTAALVKSTDFASLRKVLEEIFARNGFPKVMKSDNGPPFNGAEYAAYCEARNIDCVHSTPLYPQQNGMVERYMQTINKAMQIAVHEGSNPESAVAQAVRSHNTAKHRVTQVPPEELMFGRKVRRNLPLLASAAVSNDPKDIRAKDVAHKSTSKFREDKKRGARETVIRIGDTVVVMNQKRAKGDPRFSATTFIVKDKNRGDLKLRAEDGSELERNVTQVKKIRVEKKTTEKLNEGHQGELADPELMPSQQQSRRRARAQQEGGNAPLRRSERIRVKPKHLDMYINMLEISRVA